MRPIPVSSPIANLFPFLDQRDLLRACGRITASTALQFNERLPIILPYNCRLARPFFTPNFPAWWQPTSGTPHAIEVLHS